MIGSDIGGLLSVSRLVAGPGVAGLRQRSRLARRRALTAGHSGAMTLK